MYHLIKHSEETRQAVNVTGVHGGPLRCDHEQERRNDAVQMIAKKARTS